MRSSLWERGERGRAVVLCGAVLGAVLWPVRQNRRPAAERVDGFPLSYYPMFSAVRPRHHGVTYVVAVRTDGTRGALPDTALGPGGINQVRRQLFRVAVREGRPQEYIDALADRLVRSRHGRDVVTVEVVRGRFDLDRCMLERTVKGKEKILASAVVPHDERRLVAASAQGSA